MAEPSQVANQMMQILQNNPARVAALQADPLPELEKLKAEAEKVVPAYINDKFLYRVAVFVLGLLTIIAAVGSIILVLVGKTTPEVLVALGSAAIGALVGLFAPSPTGK